MNVTVRNALAGHRPDIGSDVEAFDRRVGLQDIQPQATQQIVDRGELLLRQIEVGRRVPVGQDEGVQVRNRRRVPDCERQIITQ